MSKPDKLPVWKTTWECYRLVFAHAGDFIRISWLWLIVMIPIYASAHAAIWYLTESPDRLTSSFHFKMLADCLPNILEAGFLSAIAVAWHQLILSGRPATTASLTLDRTVMTYAMWAVAMYLLPIIVWLLLLPSMEIPTAWVALSLAAALILLPVIAIVPLRYSLKLPAIALGQPLSFKESWQKTGGNTLRLSATVILSWLPALIALVAFGAVLPDISENPDLVTYVAVSTTMSYAYAIPAILGVTWLSLIYRHFVLTPHPLDLQGNLP